MGSVPGMPVREHRIALPSRYRVIRHIADGGMASVWAAQDELLGRIVAVKVLSPAYAADDRANRRFLREARAGARLSECRNVVTVYDIDEHGGRPFMVMEHFAGGSVADRLRNGRAIPRALALRWLREAAEALDCAHRHDVVHRDVKPANLLLDERGRLAVGDFGIATVATEASVTQTGLVLGTAAYISPEQARGEAATAASDRYALAVVAFELLTGRKPFAADHPTAQARAHVEAAVPSASEAGTGLPADVDRVLRFGMAKEPERRPSTATDLLERLEEALDRGGVAPPEPPTTVITPILTPARPRRRWPGLAAIAALALVAGSAIAIATGAGNGDHGGGSTGATHTQATQAATNPKPKAAKPKPKAQKAAPPATATQQTAPPSGSGDPVALNNQGFALIQSGQPTAAVPSLQRSVDAFRAQGRTGQIDYAYALYNLGNALRLSGRPTDAIPYLEERLRISSYKRGVVKQELKTARRLANRD
ncbi:MAG: eukaryotic-like serine/threonine-protein kinase [Solirubrobacteraceae bacterium]